jgi:hypothetical protein
MSIHGFCPHCNSNMDGELIYDTFIEQGKTPEVALEYSKNYAGWEKHGLQNRWGRKIGIYSLNLDRTMEYQCPDCGKKWDR